MVMNIGVTIVATSVALVAAPLALLLWAAPGLASLRAMNRDGDRRERRRN